MNLNHHRRDSDDLNRPRAKIGYSGANAPFFDYKTPFFTIKNVVQ